MVPVRIPGSAMGSTWWRTTCQRVAPSPYAACRMESGTARMASWAAMMMTGRINSDRVSAPERMLRWKPSARTKTASPRMPYTMDGTPARLAMLVWMTRVTQLRGAYSSR